MKNYLEVLKPRESGLLVFIGICTAFIAAYGHLELGRGVLVFFTILFASAGANGLTNYLDLDIDVRMERTSRRALPSGRIYPPEKVLPLTICLMVIGLAMAWFLHPLSFAFDLIGTTAALVYRKRVTCVFPQGAIASAAPVLMGWFAASPQFRPEIVFLCVLIALWLPSHIWSIMVAHRQEYIDAGLSYFPMSREPYYTIKVILAFNILLVASSIGLFFTGGFRWIYLAVAVILGVLMLRGSARLLSSGASKDAWRLYKLSAFPYLGVLFLAMAVDVAIMY